ncbi:MAG: hypothetical protein NT062_26325, partial [Proteobacteria bacterium]|nr:hypothetical protein [Pseudomonadota bacterium]
MIWDHELELGGDREGVRQRDPRAPTRAGPCVVGHAVAAQLGGEHALAALVEPQPGARDGERRGVVVDVTGAELADHVEPRGRAPGQGRAGPHGGHVAEHREQRRRGHEVAGRPIARVQLAAERPATIRGARRRLGDARVREVVGELRADVAALADRDPEIRADLLGREPSGL